MNQNFSQVSAFVLHARNYQENSQIIQLFSFELGRFSIIAKGIKGKRSQARKAILQPFSELKVEFTGKSDLKTLIHCETFTQHSLQSPNNISKQNTFLSMQGKALACGYYANELILRACMERQEYPELYDHYKAFIQLLKTNSFGLEKPVAPIIRDFEVALLTHIGLAPDYLFDIDQNEIKADEEYFLIPEYGFQAHSTIVNDESLENICEEPSSEYRSKSIQPVKKYDSFKGQAILSLASGEHYPIHYKSSQKIMAVFLQEVIGNKPLQSRKLWQHLTQTENKN
jgi:DNA repair protein RecO (recombination protein O)